MLTTPPQQENGVDTAIKCIYRDLEYATQLIRTKTGKNQTRRKAATASAAGTATDGAGSSADADANAAADLVDMLDDDEEESWTFVGGDPDTIDDLSVEAAMKRTVPELGAVLGGAVPVAGGAPGGKGAAGGGAGGK